MVVLAGDVEAVGVGAGEGAGEAGAEAREAKGRGWRPHHATKAYTLLFNAWSVAGVKNLLSHVFSLSDFLFKPLRSDFTKPFLPRSSRGHTIMG